MSNLSGDPSTHPVSPPQVLSGTLPSFDKKPFDGVHSIRKWIVVFGVGNTLAVATAQTVSLIISGDSTLKIGPITVQLLILNILLVVSMVMAMRQLKRRSEPFGPLVGRAYVIRILVAVAAVGVLLIYAVVPINGVTSHSRRKEGDSSSATTQDLLGGAVLAILYVSGGLQVILAILLAMEQYMEIKLRRADPTLTQSELPELYIYQPAIPLRSDFTHSHRTTRTHYIGDEEDLANKDALPAYERQRPEDHPAVQIVDMADPNQESHQLSTISPPDYDNTDVAFSEIPHVSTAAPVATEVHP